MRAITSVLLIVHLVGVLAGPLSPSILADVLRSFYRPYLEAAYLGHGYKFFAPDPGPSHLIRYDLELADGTRRSGTFPDINEHWPRLLYHRHFMLSEFVTSFPAGEFSPDGPAGEFGPPLSWEELPLSREQQAYARSYARHLLERHHAQHVSLYLVEHLIPLPEDVIQGMRLDDPRLYRSRKLIVYEGGEG